MDLPYKTLGEGKYYPSPHYHCQFEIYFRSIYEANERERVSEKMSRLTNVCFTLNDPQEELKFDDSKMGYLVYQLELSESGTPHFQGYMELKAPLRFPGIKRLLGSNKVHIESRLGSAQEASDYCKKDDTYVEGGSRFEYGVMKECRPGKRNDLEDFSKAVLAGDKRKRDLYLEYPGIMARYRHFYHDLTSSYRPERKTDLQVILHIGETGLGKTRTVFDRHGASPSFYVTPICNNTVWLDGHDLHKVVLLDDFAGAASHLPLAQLLRLLDRYPVQVPVKGSHTWWMPDIIYVTSNVYPEDWYKWDGRGGQYVALARRFTEVVMFYPKLYADDPGFAEQDENWWRDNCPDAAKKYYPPEPEEPEDSDKGKEAEQ